MTELIRPYFKEGTSRLAAISTIVHPTLDYGLGLRCHVQLPPNLADGDVVAKRGGDFTLDVRSPCNPRDPFRRIDSATRRKLPRTRTCIAAGAEML